MYRAARPKQDAPLFKRNKLFALIIILTMNKKVLVLLFCLLASSAFINAQEVKKSDLQQKAEAIDPKKIIAVPRSMYIMPSTTTPTKVRSIRV